MPTRAGLRSWTSRSASRLAPAIVAASLILGGAAVYSTAISAPSHLAPPPVNVALVDIAKLINGLKEMEDRNNVNRIKLDEFSNRLRETASEIEKLENDLKTIIPATAYAERTAAMGRLGELKAIHKTRLEVFQHQLDVIKGDMISQLYTKAMDTIQKVAAQDGIDLVMVDDRTVKLPEVGSATQLQVLNVMDTKRVLFAREGLDITDRLISRMNAEYAAGRGATPPSTPAPVTGTPVTPRQ